MSSSQCPRPGHQSSPNNRNPRFRTDDFPAASFSTLQPLRRSGSPPISLPLAASVPAPGVQPRRGLPPTPQAPFPATFEEDAQNNTSPAVNTPAEHTLPRVSEQVNVSPSTSTPSQTAPAPDLAGELNKALVPVMDELNDLNLKIYDLKDLITKQRQERGEEEQRAKSKEGEEPVEKDGKQNSWQTAKSQNVKTEKEQREADLSFRCYDREDKRLTTGDLVLGAAGCCLIYLSLKMGFRLGRGLWGWGSR